jgi:U6 snRNA-associated Sm-like protein LSm7
MEQSGYAINYTIMKEMESAKIPATKIFPMHSGGKGKGKGGAHSKPSVINLDALIDQLVRVKFTGGREITGILKSHDPVPNILLEDCVEYLRDPADSSKLTDATRKLGTVVVRGTSITFICPETGYVEIDNPFTE